MKWIKNLSFRFIITAALISVIGVVSLVSFYLFNGVVNQTLYNQAEDNAATVLTLLKNQYYFTKHDNKTVEQLLRSIEEDEHILKTYFLDSFEKVKYASVGANDSTFSNLIKEITVNNKTLIIEPYKSATPPFMRTLVRMENSESCFACHTPNQTTLGYFGYDFAIETLDANKNVVVKFSLFFTLVLIGFIVLFVIVLHYKFVKTGLAQIQKTMNSVNQGNLDERINIPNSKELATLGKNFNIMLDNFQSAQKELKFFHQRELRNNQKMATIGEMSARLAHEIRNPITGISNAIEVICDEVGNNEIKSILGEIKRQTDRVNTAVSSLLNYSNRKKPTLIKSQINDKISKVVFFFESQKLDKEIIFTKELDQTLPEFSFDHEQIERVIINLVYNAINAIDEKGVISLKTVFNREEKEVLVMVIDTGKGIPDNLKPEVFTPFYTTGTKGTGLGLAVAKDVLDKHMGDIWVEDNNPNGCIFAFSLPINLKAINQD